jgi:hypothetical protein
MAAREPSTSFSIGGRGNSGPRRVTDPSAALERRAVMTSSGAASF